MQQLRASRGINARKWMLKNNFGLLVSRGDTFTVPFSLDYTFHLMYYKDYRVHKKWENAAVVQKRISCSIGRDECQEITLAAQMETVIKPLCWQSVLSSIRFSPLDSRPRRAKHNLCQAQTFTVTSSYNGKCLKPLLTIHPHPVLLFLLSQLAVKTYSQHIIIVFSSFFLKIPSKASNVNIIPCVFLSVRHCPLCCRCVFVTASVIEAVRGPEKTDDGCIPLLQVHFLNFHLIPVYRWVPARFVFIAWI